MDDATPVPISQLPDPKQPNTTSTQIPPQPGQAVKRGRGRPRKHPLPPDYVPPVRTPKPPRESSAQRTPLPAESEEVVTTSSGRPARSSRRNVDYAKLESIEILPDGEDDAGVSTNETPASGQPKRRRGRPPKDPSKGPMPRPKPKNNVVYIEDEGDDEAVEEVDDEDDEYVGGEEQPDEEDDLDANDVVEEEDDEPESDFEEQDETSKRGKSGPGKIAQKKLKMAPGTSSTVQGSKTRKTKDSVEGRMALFYGNRNAPLMEGIEYRNKWINELTAIRQELLEDPIFPPPDDHKIDLSLQSLVTAEEEKVPLFLPPREQELTFEVGMNEPFKEYSIKANESASLHDLTDGRREGFVIHTGGYVTGCQWAPLMDSNVQYLVVSIVSKVDEFAVSMFDRATYDSVIQIWNMNPDQPGSSRARLALCLLHSWGTPWSLRFCPEAKSKNDSTVGCLAAAFQDGKVRVISVPAVDSQNTEYLMVETPAKEISLPGMSITCVTWTTRHVIAVGCTNGFVATFDLAIADEPDDDDDEARPLNGHTAPIICTPVHQSAILTLESASPDYPHVLTTTSADGYTRTLDTRDPRSCRASAYRTKGYSAAATYVPSLNAVISVEDSILTKITPILNLPTDVIFTRHEASVMCIASGKCHPFTATGGADGAVTVANPVARALVGKKITYKDWPQTRLFKLEYSERQGKFRFVEGYKVDVIGFAAGSRGKGGYLIYPETVCVTSLGWNWRRQTGGWIAAGFANGLVRIENFSM
ncbi:hypothetical protein POJ06DRAFT_105904 [Lipomyces tetrasporus]|uniref:Transcription factor TFIIIC complex subunit Tfc6 n=1 Tax=Lipomyces tetrasporus TaxID=54092 RepID=A0AAD7VSN2_9ASCO|nr:uncharacterized protein POJ06DRAFT_105904 [Lipomyces tetrasporus]KAJ8100508.1 hypothetical protein POJ06DRAFT_105904 [Lipomyces tetrasporus]